MLRKNLLKNFKGYQVFFISIIIGYIFYEFEGLVGINRYYHPDTLFYLRFEKFPPLRETLIENPSIFFSLGYQYFVKLLDQKYEYIILSNLIFYSLTNFIIYERVIKKYLDHLSFFKILLIVYLLFLDPYRLHLTAHVLKENIIIFLCILIFLTNSNFIKILSIFFLEFTRKFGSIYIFLFLNLKDLKNFKKKLLQKLKLRIFKTSIKTLLVTFLLVCFMGIIGNIYFYENLFLKFTNYLQFLHFREMPLREYDNISNFQNYSFIIGFVIKNLTWPIMYLTGIFMFFVSSILFKFLGFVIIINHMIIYFITKKTCVTVGLVTILISISIFVTSYTAMYRYCYVALFCSVVLFFYKFDIESLKK